MPIWRACRRAESIKTLADVIAFNEATPREMALFGQDIFEKAQSTGDLSDPAYIKARDDLRRQRARPLDKLLAENHLDALIRSTDDPAFRIDLVKGDNDSSNASFLPATAGYPHLTVPMGYVHGLAGRPLLHRTGLVGSEPAVAWSRLRAGDQARKPPQFLPSLEASPEVLRAFAPNAK